MICGEFEKMKGKRFLTAHIIISALLVIGVVTTATLAYFAKGDNSSGSYGEISLRSYFETGNGKKPYNEENPEPGSSPGDYPFVITRPRHLYNLSRLQDLGIFKEKTYFQLGLEGLANDESGEPRCYPNDSDSDRVVPYLDMTGSDYDNERIRAIGTEANPFYGVFDGQNLEIKNLNVFADPQDAGLFGYTAHDSSVHNLFLSNVTITTMGYHEKYDNFYGAANEAAESVKMTYAASDITPHDYVVGDNTRRYKEFDATAYFAWKTSGGDEPALPSGIPTITPSKYGLDENGYTYDLLFSGDFLKETSPKSGVGTIDMKSAFDFFYPKRESTTEVSAVSSMSLVAHIVDSEGLEHSKVLMTLSFLLSLHPSNPNTIRVEVRLESDHGNNIGLAIGHCDGTAYDIYCYQGSFVMNAGNATTETTDYRNLENRSTQGIIGLVGSTTHDIAAEESDAATRLGKSIGVLDFTSIYDTIVDESSSTWGTVTLGGNTAYKYKAKNTEQAKEYLKYLSTHNGGTDYVAYEENSVSFNCQKVITNSELGVFTIATHQTGTGTGDDAGNYLNKSVVRTDHPEIGSDYYVYYATGEYRADAGVDFDYYRDGFNSGDPKKFFPGYHFPSADQISVESFEQRELCQNYFFRFKLDPTSRTSTKDFYFSDLDIETDGGSFLSKYFNYKLVDSNGLSIPQEDPRCGVMIRDPNGSEISSFKGSFSTPDYSHAEGGAMVPINCIGSVTGKPAANMVNFEIKTEVANVTVIAANADRTKPSALGIYELDDDSYDVVGGTTVMKKDFENPDYAFFMPKDEHLAYFDYQVTEVSGEKVGQIGTQQWDDARSEFKFVEADCSTDAMTPGTANAFGGHGEPGYDDGDGVEEGRLYAHTFKLKKGRYCIGSATGKNYKYDDKGISTNTYGVPKIYYLCAQGQDSGQLDFDPTTFASNDYVEDVDFIKLPAYAADGMPNITYEAISTVTTYDADDPRLANQRCYVALTKSDPSRFAASSCNLVFRYGDPDDPTDTSFYLLSSTPSDMKHIAVNNYGRAHALTNNISELENLEIILISKDPSSLDAVVYP